MRFFAILSLLIVGSIAMDVFLCEVKVTVPDATTVPTVTLAGNQYTWDNFNAISFLNYSAKSGDIEGRGAIRNNLNLPQAGYSFGYQLRTGGVGAWDNSLPYALVVGHNAVFTDGNVLPDGLSDQLYPGATENIYCGGSFSSKDASLTSRVTSNGNLDSAFDAAQAYYTTLSNTLAAVPDNIVNPPIVYGALQLTCPSSGAGAWSTTIQASAFATISDYTLIGCNNASTLVINIAGTGSVTFGTGNSINGAPHAGMLKNERIIFNVVGSGRKISCHGSVDGTILAPNNVWNQNNGGVVKGLVIVGDAQNIDQINRLHCQPPATPVSTPSMTCVGFETTCTGLTGSANGVGFSFTEYNAISFGDFHAGTGDIEGRLAAAGNVYLGEGYSIGATLSTVNNIPDLYENYSLIVGGSLTWLSGELFPNGAGAGDEEDAYVVGTSTVASNLNSRMVNGPNIDSVFSAAHTCYNGYSDALAAKSDNVAFTLMYTGIFITCNDVNAAEYVVSFTPADLAASTYFVLNQCNFQGRWTVNIRGTGDVTFTGASFPTIPGGTVFNVIGSRNVYVHDTALTGHLLAPQATLNQTSGVIIGKVVANMVANSLQINSMSTCPQPLTVTFTMVAGSSASAGSNSVDVLGASGLVVNDVTSLGQITAINGNTVTFSNQFTQPISTGQTIGSVYISSDAARMHQANQVNNNSASVAGVAFVVVAIAALLL